MNILNSALIFESFGARIEIVDVKLYNDFWSKFEETLSAKYQSKNIVLFQKYWLNQCRTIFSEYYKLHVLQFSERRKFDEEKNAKKVKRKKKDGRPEHLITFAVTGSI